MSQSKWYVVPGPGEQGPEFDSWEEAREYALDLQKRGVPARILGPGCGWSYEDEPPSEYTPHEFE
jgi:hypothetical protein